MLDFIRSAPLLFALGAGALALVSGGGAWAARGWVFDTFERPAIVKAEQAQCATRVEAAATAAKAAEQLRQFRIGEQAYQQSAERDAEDKAWADARLAQLQRENEDYARERRKAGRICDLTRGDIDYVVGVRDDGAAH